MSFHPLDPARKASLRRAPFSYPEVGGTRGEALPPGYRILHETVVIPTGLDLQACRSVLLRWGLQSGAGVRVVASGPVEPAPWPT